MEIELSTTKTVGSEKRRLARCDDDGRLEVVVISEAGEATESKEATQLSVKTAVEALQTATGAVTPSPTANTLLARLKDILSLTVLAAGENHVGEVGGNMVPISAEMTRPAAGDVNAYITGDVVSNSTTTTTPIQLTNIFRVAGGSGYIVKIRIVTDKKSITPRLRVHFFNANTATLAGDNLPYKEVYADSAKRLGYWDMPAMTTATDTTNSDMSRTLDLTCRIAVTAAAASRDLFVVFETLDAFTPASGQKFNITVVMDNN
jgi:hypothetical protein